MTRLFGLAVVLFGFYTLFKLYTDLGVLAQRYVMSLGMVSFTFTEQTIEGTKIGVAVQLTAFALVCFFVGGMTLVESTRIKSTI
ncbi:hypothetical protein L593_08495 [Salinarchaeum sp. Harcht-Bsk1]|nr:hypothetical protein L593_08495 [Salinarchaeum sp. Harcht-Bsk1]